MLKHSWQRAFAGMWGGLAWRDVQPVVIGVSLFAAFGFTTLLYAVDARLNHYDSLCNDPSSSIYIEDTETRRATCE